MKLDELLVLSEVVNKKKVKVAELANIRNMGAYRVQSVIEKLCSLEFIESSGKTSGLSYILHVSKRKDMDDKIDYVKSKKQEKDRSKVSRLFAELMKTRLCKRKTAL